MAAASIATARIAALPATTARHRRRRIHRAQATHAQAASPSEDDVDGTRATKMPIEDTAPTVMPSRRAALLSAAAASSIILPSTPSLAIPSYNVTLAKLDKEARDKASSVTVVTPEEQKAATKKIYKGLAAQGEVLTPVGDGSISLSPMGIGTWSWGNQFVWGYDESMDPELARVFNEAVESGINVFDTADSYGTGNGLDGRSEVLIGQFLRQCPSAKVDGVNIATKFAAYPWRVTPNSVVVAARESAARLDRPSIELGQLHWSTVRGQTL